MKSNSCIICGNRSYTQKRYLIKPSVDSYMDRDDNIITLCLEHSCVMDHMGVTQFITKHKMGDELLSRGFRFDGFMGEWMFLSPKGYICE